MAASMFRGFPGRRLAVALLTLAVAGACSDPVTGPSVENTAFDPALGVDLAASTRLATGVYRRDIVVGTGATAAAGDSLSVRYNGYLANGFEFDNNTGTGEPLYTFRVGANIPGFDAGIIGMKVGGIRQIIIPPDQGYGSMPYRQIPGNSILVFRVELIAKH